MSVAASPIATHQDGAGACARALLIAGVLLTLAGCATRPRAMSGDPAFEQAAEQRLSRYESASFAQPNFSLRGRIGVSNGKDAGSAQFVWEQEDQRFDFTLEVSITGKRYALRGREGAVELVDAEGQVRTGFNAEQLLLEATGWRVPVAELRYWIRATRAPGAQARLKFAQDGRLLQLRQSGWLVEYQRWQDDSVLPVPLKMQASSGKNRVRVVIREWRSVPDID